MSGEHDDAIAAKAPQANVGTDACYLPVDSAAGVGLAKRDDIACLYAVRVLASRVRHFFGEASGAG